MCKDQLVRFETKRGMMVVFIYFSSVCNNSKVYRANGDDIRGMMENGIRVRYYNVLTLSQE